jgi:hypothetical protein
MFSAEAFLFSSKIPTDTGTKVFEKRKIETKNDIMTVAY